jgi:hypothetical protein
MFSEFQPRCKRRAIRIVGMKMKSRLDKMQSAGAAPISVDSDSSSNEIGDENEDDRSVVDDAPVANESITKVKLSNLDLGHVITDSLEIQWNFGRSIFVSHRRRSSRPGSRLVSCRILGMRLWTIRCAMSLVKV